ncbi:hypothetical protein SKAU_G00426410 [Synaphobranchus kaupii]|uniref:Uncharacterized protein n=1 Tax=Synaphobranchus kaupii TaxID=118154 RepID=A0A9Q1E588_SYNKA|nr:hypothetical protein SKAU_G00426410 [Synaphobranchus kaupii]
MPVEFYKCKPCEAAFYSHPYQPENTCYVGSRALVVHEADRTLINAHEKLVAHCIVDYCLPRHMYSSAPGSESLKTCREHLLKHYRASRRGWLGPRRPSFR